MLYSLAGLWQAELNDGTQYPITLPGTLDENKIGYKDVTPGSWHPDVKVGNDDGSTDPNTPIATRFTRKYTYEGPAKLTRRISYVPPEGKRIFLEAERGRSLKLFVDGGEIPNFIEPTISTPHVFEITNLLTGDNELTLISDNSYPNLPHDPIVYSSAATSETQTNWNGILGYLRLRMEEPTFLSTVRVYPKRQTLTVCVEVSAIASYNGSITISSNALLKPATIAIDLPAGLTEIVLSELPIADHVLRWDEYEGNLYELTASLYGFASKTVTFGVRDFGDDGNGRLAVNGRTIFLRSEANCAVFPETGYPPMAVDEWLSVLNTYKSYGINCMRFHSYCPPEAAFTAADQLGMLMQPELSHWNPRNALEPEDSFAYYQVELRRIILALANHPSFLMLTFGNELCANELGHTRMSLLLDQARKLDNTRLYANGSNVHYGTRGCDADSDFYTSQGYFGDALRGSFAAMPDSSDLIEQGSKKEIGIKGFINNQYPNAKTNYHTSMENLRKTYRKPVFSFEVGQYEILPDFDELTEFNGISEPTNLKLIKKRVEDNGLTDTWRNYVEATGELSRIGYREEIEAAMRTETLSGISLLGLQDFPGQGTALVGMLNSHLQPKPYRFAAPEGFRAFFRDQLPLVYLPKYTFETTEKLTAEIKVANYGKDAIIGCPTFEIKGKDISIIGTLPEVTCPIGRLTTAGTLEIPLNTITACSRLDLIITINHVTNTYPIWVYLPTNPICPESIYESRSFDEKTKAVLKAGGTVYLSPAASKEALPNSIRTQFTTDFWSVGTFPMQAGGMGQLIDANHPIFADFPTETHTNWQWWPMATQRAVMLPYTLKTIITEMDSYAYMRPMAQLLECRCDNGKLLLSSLGLQDLQQYSEARALLSSIYRYLASDKFTPEQELPLEVVQSLVR